MSRRVGKGVVAIGLVACGCALFSLTACNGEKAADLTPTDGGSTGSGRTLRTGITESSSVTTAHGDTCKLLTRDTSSCQATREALGFSGDWLSFSCNVKLTPVDGSNAAVSNVSSATSIAIGFTGLPDHKSTYFATTGTYSFTDQSGTTVSGNYSDMYQYYDTIFDNPNKTAQKSYVLYVPASPARNNGNNSTHQMGMGIVGVAVDGVPIYNSLADASDNIYSEEGSFDECQGHPDAQSKYHYHSLPYSISYNDSKLVGIMRDGFFIYGQYDYGGNTDLDTSTKPPNAAAADGVTSVAAAVPYVFGGHEGALPTTGTGNVFHYHATAQYGCTDRDSSPPFTIHSVNDGDVYDNLTAAQAGCTGTGTIITAYFLTGHGNGGTFVTPPTTPTSVHNQTSAHRYYYGTAGTCTGC
jgi:hypothetical protein